MGLDMLHLRVLATSSDDPEEKKNAQKGDLIIPKQKSIVLGLRFLTVTSSEPHAERPPLDPCGEFCVFYVL